MKHGSLFSGIGGFDYSIVKEISPYTYSYRLLHNTQGRFYNKGYEAAESALLDELLTILEKEKKQWKQK
jgi:hypothetical protein